MIKEYRPSRGATGPDPALAARIKADARKRERRSKRVLDTDELPTPAAAPKVVPPLEIVRASNVMNWGAR